MQLVPKAVAFLQCSVISLLSRKLDPSALNTVQHFHKTASWKEAGAGSVAHIQPHYCTLLGNACGLLGCHQETVKLLFQCLHSHFPLFLHFFILWISHSLIFSIPWHMQSCDSSLLLSPASSWKGLEDFVRLSCDLNPIKAVADSCKRNCLKEAHKPGYSLPYILYLLPHPP